MSPIRDQTGNMHRRMGPFIFPRKNTRLDACVLPRPGLEAVFVVAVLLDGFPRASICFRMGISARQLAA